LLPSECKPEDECLCLPGEQVDSVVNDLIESEKCQEREKSLQLVLREWQAHAIPEKKPEAWFEQRPTIIGGFVLSFIVGGLLAKVEADKRR
jgi:hypothetical protein